MTATDILIGLAALCIIWYIAANILIFNALRKRGKSGNFLLWRAMILSYANRYQRITREETGKTGPLFYHWIISINAVLVCVIVALLIR